MNSIADIVIDKFHKAIEHYVSVEEIIDLMDKITSQMDYVERIVQRKPSILCTTNNVLSLVPHYPLMYHNDDIAHMYEIKNYLEGKVKWN